MSESGIETEALDCIQRLKMGSNDSGINGVDTQDHIAVDNANDVERTGGEDEVRLERTLSLFDGIMINVGVMIGAGIFISPKGVLAGVHSVGATLVIWIASGLISLCGAMCYAELGTMIRASGGSYTYIRVTFGDFVAFVIFWANTLFMLPAADAIIALAFAYYCLQPFFPDPDCPVPEAAITLVAVLCTLFLTFVNCWSVRLSSRLQDWTSIFKLLALATVIITGVVMLCQGRTGNFNNAFLSTDLKSIGPALYSSLYAYAGWDSLNLIVGELKNPSRNLPIAIVMSIVIVTLVYTFTNVAYFTLLSPTELLRSDAVAYSFTAEVMGKFALATPVVVALSCLGSLNGSLLTMSRQVQVAASAGHFPRLTAMISLRRKTPVPSVITMCILTSCFCFSGSILKLINYYSVIKWLSYLFVAISLLYLRVKEPHRPRPYKVNLLIAISFLIVCLFLLVSGIVAAPVDAAIGCAILVSAVPFYFVGVKWKTRARWMVGLERALLIVCQKLLLVVSEDPSEDTDT